MDGNKIVLSKCCLICLVMVLQIYYANCSNYFSNSKSETVHFQTLGTEYEKAVTITRANLGQVYSNKTDRANEFQYLYKVNLGNFPPRSLRLRVDVEGMVLSSDKPIRVTARFNKGTASWTVPIEISHVRYDFVERTLCLSEAKDITSLESPVQDIEVIISTSNSNQIKFRLVLQEVKNFTASVNQPVKVKNVGASSPVYHYVNIQAAPKDSLLLVKVKSEDSVCAMVSVQPFNCPVSDTVEAIRMEGAFQTMLNVASFTIERNKYENGGFIVFLVLNDDALCGNMTSQTTNRLKTFQYEISDRLSKRKIYLEIIATVAFLFILGLFAIITTICCSAYKSRKIEGGIEVADGKRDTNCCFPSRRQKVFSISRPPVQFGENRLEEEEPIKWSRVKSLKKPVPKFVIELSQKGIDPKKTKIFKSMFQKSGLYMWLVLTMGIFYGIPAIQLVLNYQEKLIQLGDADMCYYNFLCSIPVLNVVDFNHIFSNIGYLFFGLLFLGLTAYEEHKYKKLNPKKTNVGTIDPETVYGIPQHYGIFYAMGFALIFEGILSACYHVCPTNENFQFDTTFMYLIAVLCFMKIYQFRHPDVTSNAYKVFLGIALVMFLEVIGIFYKGHLFWILSLVVYFLTVVLLTAIIYHSGNWAMRPYTLVRVVRSLWKLLTLRRCSKNYSAKRIIFVTCLNLANLAFMIYGAVLRPGISSYLLMIFVANLVIYSIYYVSLKIYYKEKIRPFPKSYAILCLLCWVPALYFYSITQKSTDVTPAESRNLNEECVFMDMYDNHDIWHFFSAGGLFFAFMFLLTLDDGLHKTPRNTIVIF